MTSNVIVTKVWSESFWLVLPVRHICANSVNFPVTRGLPVTILHSMCISCAVWYHTVLANNTAVVCMYVRIVCLPVQVTWRPLVSAITTVNYDAMCLHCWVWYHAALSLHCVCIRSSGIVLIHKATFVSTFLSVTSSIADLAHGEKCCTQSTTQSSSLFDVPYINCCIMTTRQICVTWRTQQTELQT